MCRAICIAARRDYKEVAKFINECARTEMRRRSTIGSGIASPTTSLIMMRLGFKWVPTMKIGGGCRVHLRADELPGGRIIARCSHHVVAVIDGVCHDNHDPTRGGRRAVYGYWIVEEQKSL